VVKSAENGIERNRVRRKTGGLLERPGKSQKRGRSSISANPGRHQDPISTIVIALVEIAAPPKASKKVRQHWRSRKRSNLQTLAFHEVRRKYCRRNRKAGPGNIGIRRQGKAKIYLLGIRNRQVSDKMNRHAEKTTAMPLHAAKEMIRKSLVMNVQEKAITDDLLLDVHPAEVTATAEIKRSASETVKGGTGGAERAETSIIVREIDLNGNRSIAGMLEIGIDLVVSGIRKAGEHLVNMSEINQLMLWIEEGSQAKLEMGQLEEILPFQLREGEYCDRSIY
jgi:hypothetical protein